MKHFRNIKDGNLKKKHEKENRNIWPIKLFVNFNIFNRG